MKTTNLCLAFLCSISITIAVAAPKTWTFAEDGKIRFSSGGMTFSKGGRINAEFLRLDGANVILKIIDGGDGSVPLSSLSERDRAYVAQVNGIPVDVDRLEREAQERQRMLRLQAETIERANAEKNAAALAAQAKKKEQEELKAADLDNRMAPFKPLFEGEPPIGTDKSWYYRQARKPIEQVANANSLIHSQRAREILKLADEITQDRLKGFSSPADVKAGQIKQTLGWLLDDGVLLSP